MVSFARRCDICYIAVWICRSGLIVFRDLFIVRLTLYCVPVARHSARLNIFLRLGNRTFGNINRDLIRNNSPVSCPEIYRGHSFFNGADAKDDFVFSVHFDIGRICDGRIVCNKFNVIGVKIVCLGNERKVIRGFSFGEFYLFFFRSQCY